MRTFKQKLILLVPACLIIILCAVLIGKYLYPGRAELYAEAATAYDKWNNDCTDS